MFACWLACVYVRPRHPATLVCPLRQDRTVTWVDVDGVAILAANKGVPVKATIEHMRDGSSYRCVCGGGLYLRARAGAGGE